MAIARSEFLSKVNEFIKNMLVESGDDKPLQTSDSLIESGRLASVNVIEIVSFLEEEFDIDYSEVDFDLDNFETIETLADSLELK